jgi:hypothetical protein
MVFAFLAELTRLAERFPEQCDVVANFDTLYLASNSLDDSCAFVAWDKWYPSGRQFAVENVLFRVAQSHRFHANEDFGGTRGVEYDVFDREWLVDPSENDCTYNFAVRFLLQHRVK